MNRRKQQIRYGQKRKHTREIYRVNFAGIEDEAEKLRRRLRIPRRVWKKIR